MVTFRLRLLIFSSYTFFPREARDFEKYSDKKANPTGPALSDLRRTLVKVPFFLIFSDFFWGLRAGPSDVRFTLGRVYSFSLFNFLRS